MLHTLRALAGAAGAPGVEIVALDAAAVLGLLEEKTPQGLEDGNAHVSWQEQEATRS